MERGHTLFEGLFRIARSRIVSLYAILNEAHCWNVPTTILCWGTAYQVLTLPWPIPNSQSL